MNLFHLLGYTIEKPYSKNSKTNVGEFALIKVISVTKGIYYGALVVPLANLKIGSITPTSVYFGSNKIL